MQKTALSFANASQKSDINRNWDGVQETLEYVELDEYPNNIRETPGGYLKSKSNSAELISNFVIYPKKKVLMDNQELMEVELVRLNGEKRVILLEREDWNNRSKFLKKIPSSSFSYGGSTSDLQKILAIVAHYQISCYSGKHVLGYHQDADGTGCFLLPNQVILSENPVDIVHIPEKANHHPIGELFRPISFPQDEVGIFLQTLLPNLMRLRSEPGFLAILGWMFATPFKPQLMAHIGHFPLLNIYGTTGAGKSTVARTLWRMFGFVGDLCSCTQSPFSWQKLCSSTNVYPFFFDEYKPANLPGDKLKKLHKYAHEAYAGAVNFVGRYDQSTVPYRIEAPMAVIGEVAFQEPALLERILPAPLSSRKITQENRNAYHELNQLSLNAFLQIYLKWCLTVDIEELWRECWKDSPELSDRVRDNIAVGLFGLRCLKRFASDHNVDIGDLDEQSLIELCREEVGEEKAPLDKFIEKIAYLAESGKLVKDQEYALKERGKGSDKICVCLRLGPVVEKYAKHTWNDGTTILNAKAYRQMFKEETGTTYVLEYSQKVRFGAGSYQAVVVDLDKAKEMGLEVDGFLAK